VKVGSSLTAALPCPGALATRLYCGDLLKTPTLRNQRDLSSFVDWRMTAAMMTAKACANYANYACMPWTMRRCI
jgi:hypothetical protein